LRQPEAEEHFSEAYDLPDCRRSDLDIGRHTPLAAALALVAAG
jgi:hypothetical protein